MHAYPDIELAFTVDNRPDMAAAQRSATGWASDRRPVAARLAASLAIDGLETRFALCGVDALKMLEFWQPHVFVLDVSMPEHDGFAIARVLRGMPASREAAIIAFTALGRAEFVVTGPVVDFDGYCQKGGSHAPLLKMINGMLI
ncbi:response regulator [Paraburkholderia fungorum]|uniref:response regulator n=1 Tax=Paraburkholderia fungorum TaxID=134537 RepID=UPI0038BBA488